jgi:hypothetical protein
VSTGLGRHDREPRVLHSSLLTLNFQQTPCESIEGTRGAKLSIALSPAGLTTTFSAGTIYCSAVTANLLVKDMRLNPSCIQPLPLNTPLLVDGIIVTLIDANHCPGAVLLLFKTPPPPGSEFSEQVHS